MPSLSLEKPWLFSAQFTRRYVREPTSIEMVIYTAVGGRMSIFGAVWGALLVNFAKTSLSESFPQLWLFGLGALFIAVVLAFPNGLSGIWADHIQPRIDRLLSSRKSKSAAGMIADGAPAE